jgi:hypothetical protein
MAQSWPSTARYGYSGPDLGRGDSINFTEKYNPNQFDLRDRVADVISVDGLLSIVDRNFVITCRS